MSQNNANPQAAAEEKKPCVLIVDDSPDVHRLLRARLRQEEIDIISATRPMIPVTGFCHYSWHLCDYPMNHP